MGYRLVVIGQTGVQDYKKISSMEEVRSSVIDIFLTEDVKKVYLLDVEGVAGEYCLNVVGLCRVDLWESLKGQIPQIIYSEC